MMPLAGGEIDGASLANWLRTIQPKLVIIEKVHAMPKQGVTSMFNFGKGYGTLIGVCEGCGIPFQLVTPQAWKNEVLAGTAKDKDAAINFVRRRYPNINLTPGKTRKPQDGIADAVCMAHYGLYTLLRS